MPRTTETDETKVTPDNDLHTIEEAIGQLATLVSRHAKINYKEFPALSHITAGFVERQQAREAETAARLRELDDERKALLKNA